MLTMKMMVISELKTFTYILDFFFLFFLFFYGGKRMKTNMKSCTFKDDT